MMTRVRRPLILALTLGLATASTGVLAGCGEEEEGSPTMRPGEACLSCHRSGGKADEERFTAAGTVYGDANGSAPLAGATISITDANQRQVTLTSNTAGNFYTKSTLTPPLTIVVSDGTQDATMLSGASSGDCNGCHAPSGSAAARVFVP